MKLKEKKIRAIPPLPLTIAKGAKILPQEEISYPKKGPAVVSPACPPKPLTLL